MEQLTNAEQIQACVSLIADPTNWLSTVGYGSFFILLAIFALIKKSLPSFLTDILKSIVNVIPKKKK